ncbi:YdeI/OmpD-associated family protein [Mesorhizobium amorphae]|uniref:YdeI/OmpD-associated family protein n=1 Tax=Mesorhizobium amorphae TaxID=71433 RepID=UPI00118395CD|nr:YdeI/OmpD-associated family protein [Mesorhizobium amorphae]
MRIDESNARNDVQTLSPASRKEWRDWLEKNGDTVNGARLVIHHKTSETPGVHFHEAIEDALCYGWADGRATKRDGDSFYLTLQPRSTTSAWDRINRERAEKLIDHGRMRDAGLAAIRRARSAGTWESPSSEKQIDLPPDLQREFDENRIAYRNFERLPSPSRALILNWIDKATQPETRRRRIEQTIALAESNASVSVMPVDS